MRQQRVTKPKRVPLDITERDERRFWSKVALPNEQGCMLWLRATSADGYGRIGLGRGRVVYAHRFAYELLVGVIPDGLIVDHVEGKGCTNRHCVAPEHLEAVTHAENNRRGKAWLTQLAKTHCPQGHPYAGDNLYVSPKGYRQCRTCRRASDRATRQR